MWLQILTPHLLFTREILTLTRAVNSGTHPRPPRSLWERLVGPESRSRSQDWCSLAKGKEWNQGPGYEILHQAGQPSSTRHDEGWRGSLLSCFVLGHSARVPEIAGQPKTAEIYSLTVLEPEVQNQDIVRAILSPKALGEILSCLSPRFWWLLALLGMGQHNSNVSSVFTLPSSLGVSVSTCSSLFS